MEILNWNQIKIKLRQEQAGAEFKKRRKMINLTLILIFELSYVKEK